MPRATVMHDTVEHAPGHRVTAREAASDKLLRLSR